MQSTVPTFDDDQAEDFSANEDPDPSDQDPQDELDNATPTDPCPHCGQPVYESAEFCHHCGKYISQEDAPTHHPRWYSFGVLLCVALVLLAAAAYLLMLFAR
jgi:hypothetical protein